MDNKIFNGPETLAESGAPWDNCVSEDYHVAIFLDKYPCTPGHLLFVPKFNSLGVLHEAFDEAVSWGQTKVEAGEWDGFNVGFNYGSAAGQTVPWPHVHLIPRRKGDVEDPIGGVRAVIPGKGNYRSPSYK